MQAIQLRLKDRSRFRLGNVDLSSLTQVIHSDTLFSGVVNTYRMLYGSDEASDFANWFQDGKIKISSAFYCVEIVNKDQDVLKTLYFLPKPFLRFRPLDEAEREGDEIAERKAIKKLTFLSQTLFEQALQQVEQDSKGDWVSRLNLLECPTFGEEFAFNPSELEDIATSKLKFLKFKREAEEPKVQLLRSTNTSGDIYYQTDCELGKVDLNDWTFRPHFYFLVERSLSTDEEKKFLASLRLLGDEGIGGERSTGRGQFDGVQLKDFVLNTTGEMQIALSLVSPAHADDMNKLYAYEIIQRGGFVHSGRGTSSRKRKVRMLKEGAAFIGSVAGRLVSTKPANANLDHEVWANGINFGVHFGGAR